MPQYPDPLSGFSEPTQTWFRAAFAEPTSAQAGAWQSIASGHHTLVVAPTGSGKTLSAFLASIDRLLTTPIPEDKTKRTRVLYVSPLKALAVDIERLRRINHTLSLLGPEARRRTALRPRWVSPNLTLRSRSHSTRSAVMPKAAFSTKTSSISSNS